MPKPEDRNGCLRYGPGLGQLRAMVFYPGTAGAEQVGFRVEEYGHGRSYV